MIKVESALLLLGTESIIKLVQICNNGKSQAQRMCKTNGGHSDYVELRAQKLFYRGLLDNLIITQDFFSPDHKN